MCKFELPQTPLQILGALQHGSKIYGLLRKQRKTHKVYQVFIASLDSPGEIEDITKAISMACKIPLVRKGLKIPANCSDDMLYIAACIERDTKLTGLDWELITNDYREQ